MKITLSGELVRIVSRSASSQESIVVLTLRTAQRHYGQDLFEALRGAKVRVEIKPRDSLEFTGELA